MLGTTKAVVQGWREAIASWASLQPLPINDCRPNWPGCYLDPEVGHPVMLAVVDLDEWHGAMDRQKSVAAAVVAETGSIDCYAAPAVAMVLIAGVVSDAVPVGPSAIGGVVAVMAEAVVETESVVSVGLPAAARSSCLGREIGCKIQLVGHDGSRCW